MKKTYTFFLLLLAFFVSAQDGKVKESSKEGFYLKQVGDEIKILNRNSSSGGQETGSGFSSPNDVVIKTDTEGNRYWVLIDGTVAKYEAARDIPEVKKRHVDPMPVSVKKTEDKPVSTEKKAESRPAAPSIKKEHKVKKEKAIKTKGELKEKTIPSSLAPEEVIAPAPVEAPVYQAPAKKEEKVIVIEEVQAPVQVESTKPRVVTEAPDYSEEINVTSGEVGDVSQLFEKNYEDMSRKERKEYKKNEKKIMKRLEKELKDREKENN